MAEETDSPAALARGLMAAGGSAALATLEAGGAPFASHVAVGADADLAPLLLLSRLAVHSRNLENDARASLLFVREPAPGEETLTAVRLTLTGRCAPAESPDLRRRYLDARPEARHYAGFADFVLYRFDVEAGHLVAGFGRIVGLTRAELMPRSAE
jgi:heme iron utilization protein